MSKILDSSELSSYLLEMGVEYYLACIREGMLCGKGVEPPRGGGRLSRARESQLFFGVYYNKNVFEDTVLDLSVLLSICRAYLCMFGWLCRATCSVVSTSMLGVSNAVQNKNKLWKFTQSDR